MTNLFEVGLLNAALATALAIVVWLVTRRWRHPVLVHTLWVIVLVKLVTPPMVTIPWRLASAPTSMTASSSHVDAAVNSDGRQINEVWPPPSTMDFIVQSEDPLDDPTVLLPTESIDWSQQELQAISIPWRMLAIVVWLSGSALFIFVSAVRLIRFHRALAGTAPASYEIHTLAENTAARFGLTRRYRLRVTEGRLPPLVWPLGRPTIVVPRRLLTELSRDEIQTLLAHELAHLRRHDHWVRWLELGVTAIYCWHPVVWWARTSIQQAEEAACDAWVVSALPNSTSRYASALFKAVQFISEDRQPEPLLASALGSGGELKERIEHVMNATWQPRLLLPVRLSVLVAALLVLPLSLPAVQATDEPAPSSDQAYTRDVQDAAATDDVDDAGSDIPPIEVTNGSADAEVDLVEDALLGPVTPDPQPVPEASTRTPENAPNADSQAQRIRRGTFMAIQVAGAPAAHPINHVYALGPDGNVALGPVYGRVWLDGMTVSEAESALVAHLKTMLKDPRVQVTVVTPRPDPVRDRERGSEAGAVQAERRRVPVPADPYHIAPGDVLSVMVIGTWADGAIAGDYVVEPSGSLPLGPAYGRVKVAGLTLEEAEKAVAAYLPNKKLKDPKVQITIGGWRGAATSFVPPTPASAGNPFSGEAYPQLPSANESHGTGAGASSNRAPDSDLNSFRSSQPTPQPTQNVEARQQPRGQTNPEELNALREHVQFLENHFRKADALFRTGSAGGSAFSQALAGYALAAAQGELMLAEGNRAGALTRFAEAEKYAEQALVAAQAAYSANMVKDDALLQAAKNLSEIKRRLIHARQIAESSDSRIKGGQLDTNDSLREPTQSNEVSGTTDTIGILRIKSEMAKQEYGRMQQLAKDNVVSAVEVSRAKGEYEISVLRIRQAERALKYREAVLAAAKADYEMLVEVNKRAPQTITSPALRRAKLAVELAKAKLEELSE